MLSTVTNQVKNDVANEIVARSKELRANSKQIKIKYKDKELGYRFVDFKASFKTLQEEFSNFPKTTKENSLSGNSTCNVSQEIK